MIPYELWPHLVDVAGQLERGESLIILKARQLGISWLLAAYARWRAQSQPGALILQLSQGQAEAFELLDKSRRIDGPSAPTEIDRDGRIGYVGGGSILALPATEKAGRGYTASTVLADEAAFHPYAAKNYAAYRPTLDGGGQLIVVSTANGAAGWFHDMWQSAVAGEVPLTPVFIPWHARPGRDAEWLAREKAAFKGLPGEFAQEYPNTADEAFVAHSGLVYGLDELGIRIFDPEFNVREPATSWQDARWRIVGIDPGGSDPTGLVALGVDEDGIGMHVHAAQRIHGAASVEQLSTVLGQWEREGHIDAIVVDPSDKLGHPTLRAMGWPAYPANNDKRLRITWCADNLRRRNLTVSPGLRDIVDEFHSYWYVQRREGTVGGSNAIVTRGGDGHHADLLDAMGYAVIAAVQGSWRGARIDPARTGYDTGIAPKTSGATTLREWRERRVVAAGGGQWRG